MSAENIYNAQQTFKELFRKLAEVKTNCSSDLMCFGLWQLVLFKSAYVHNFSNVKTNIVPFDYQLKEKKNF